MRVIGGKFRGKLIHDPIDKTTRPLKNIVRESIFNILEHSKNETIKFKNDVVLDLFSGSGSFGIECLSRGAKKVYFFENYKPSLIILGKNINDLELSKNSIIKEMDAYEISKDNIKNEIISLIYLDPPFKDKKINKLLKKIKNLNIAQKRTLIIIHRNKKFKEEFIEDFKILREKTYGLSKITFGKLLF
tara:strand:+ start:1315 stop:1881 length:567 start_codon:yes stop_codon:yes gene_type:complete